MIHAFCQNQAILLINRKIQKNGFQIRWTVKYIQQIEKFSPDTALRLSRSAKTVFLHRRIFRLTLAKMQFLHSSENFSIC
jgi:hypothetical protein